VWDSKVKKRFFFQLWSTSDEVTTRVHFSLAVPVAVAVAEAVALPTFYTMWLQKMPLIFIIPLFPGVCYMYKT
jgi:hypothetical protein